MKKALLMIGGRYHRFESCARILCDFLEDRQVAECVVCEDREAFRDLGGFDAVIVYADGGELTPAQEAGLCDWVAEGGAFVGLHCAADSWVGNDRYMEMIGTQFESHGPVTEFLVNVKDLDHDVTRRMAEFRITDEFYLLKKRTKADLHWLMGGCWQAVNHPMAYVREYGRGRVFYTALGHDERAFTHPGFQKLVHRGLAWATRSCKPGPIRFGVVGYGPTFNMGRHHAETIRNTRQFELTAVCDLDPLRLEAARTELPDVETFHDLRELIAADLVDVATIVTPHDSHAPLARELLQAGIGVVCEKPFCLTAGEATELIETARSRNVLLTVFHNRRWDADYLALRRIIADGLLGEVFHIEAYRGEYAHPGYWWRSHRPVGGGLMYDWGAHFVDWILHLMPHRMESVSGSLSKRVWHDVTNDDHGKIFIHFEGGRTAELELSYLSAADKPKWRILGTRGGLVCDWEPPVHVTTYVNGRREKLDVPFTPTPLSPAFYAGLADHLLCGEPLPITPESARRVIAVLELAEKSSRAGQPEPVPFED